MDIKHQSLVLDINETRNYTLIKACQGDQKSRYIDCTLTQNGSVLSLTSNYRAIVKASINNEVKAINSCTIDTTSQVIVVELTSIMLDTPGILNCEITVQDGQQIVTSQAFAVQVRQSTIANETEIKKSKEYGALVDALSSIADVESKADKVQGLVDNIDKLESADDIINRLSTSETNIETNKVSIKELSELVQEVKNSAIAEIESLKSGKLDKTDFNSYKTSNDNAVNSKVDTTDFNTYKNVTNKAVKDNADNIKLLDTNKANLVQSHNLFDWSKLDGKSTGGLSAVKVKDGSYHITGTPTNKYVALMNERIKLQEGKYYVSSNKSNTDNCYVQVAITDNNNGTKYYTDSEFIVDDTTRYVLLSVQTGTYTEPIDLYMYPCLCMADDKNKILLPYNVADGVYQLSIQTQKELQKKEQKITDLAIKNKTEKSSSCVVYDCSNEGIRALTMYGKSIQEATPSLDEPTDIKDVENPSIFVAGKNLFDFNVLKNNLGINIAGGVTVTKVDNAIKYTTIEHDYLIGIYLRLMYLNLPFSQLDRKNITISCDVTSTADCTFRLTTEFNNYQATEVKLAKGKKQRVSITSPYVDSETNRNKAICFYVYKSVATEITLENVMLEVNDIATDYEEYKSSQNCEITNAILKGVGGVCDTLTINADGTGYITQRLFAERITSQRKPTSFEWSYSNTTHRFFRNDYSYSFSTENSKPLILCTHFCVGENEKNTAFDNSIGWINASGVGIAIRMNKFDGDIESFKRWLDDNEVYVVAPRSKPMTVNLSKNEVDKIISLHTYYPNTTIIADCDCQVEYVADTKNYIDNKFNELATAIVAHESEVN